MRNVSATVHPQLFSCSLQIKRNSRGSNSVNDAVRIPPHTNRTHKLLESLKSLTVRRRVIFKLSVRPVHHEWMEIYPCRCTCVKWKTSQVIRRSRSRLHWLDVSSWHINRTVWFICSFLWVDHARKVCHLPWASRTADMQSCTGVHS